MLVQGEQSSTAMSNLAYLEWSTGQDEAIARMVILSQHKRQLGLGVLHSVTFVNDHMHPFDFAQDRAILDDIFKCRQ